MINCIHVKTLQKYGSSALKMSPTLPLYSSPHHELCSNAKVRSIITLMSKVTCTIVSIWFQTTYFHRIVYTTWLRLFLVYKCLHTGSFDRNRVVVSLRNTWLYPIYYAGGSSKDQTSNLKECVDHDVFSSWMDHPFTASNFLVQPSVVRSKKGWQ